MDGFVRSGGMKLAEEVGIRLSSSVLGFGRRTPAACIPRVRFVVAQKTERRPEPFFANLRPPTLKGILSPCVVGTLDGLVAEAAAALLPAVVASSVRLCLLVNCSLFGGSMAVWTDARCPSAGGRYMKPT